MCDAMCMYACACDGMFYDVVCVKNLMRALLSRENNRDTESESQPEKSCFFFCFFFSFRLVNVIYYVVIIVVAVAITAADDVCLNAPVALLLFVRTIKSVTVSARLL